MAGTVFVLVASFHLADNLRRMMGIGIRRAIIGGGRTSPACPGMERIQTVAIFPGVPFARGAAAAARMMGHMSVVVHHLAGFAGGAPFVVGHAMAVVVRFARVVAGAAGDWGCCHSTAAECLCNLLSVCIGT